MRVCGSITSASNFDVDLGGLIKRYRAEYDAVELAPGYEPWQRPEVFLAEMIEETCIGIEGPLVADGFLEIDFIWRKPMWDELVLEMPELDPDPTPERAEIIARQPGPGQQPLL